MKPIRILIADDKEDNRYLLRTLLRGHGYEVAEAGNGAEALQMARKTKPDLIISDVLMPVMDGFSLCREWKKDARLQTAPFIFYTATYTDERDRTFALSLGADQFIVKPDDPPAFLDKLQNVLQHAGRLPAQPQPPTPPSEEAVFLQQYNETLIRKLQDKMQQLQQDIAARQKVEEELRSSEIRFRELFTHMTSGVALHEIIRDRSGRPCDYRFLQVNPAFETLTGLKAADLLGRTVLEVLPKTEAVWIKRYGKVATTGEPIAFESFSQELNRHFHVSAYCPKPEHFAVIFSDVTDRVKAEEALHERETFVRQLMETIPIPIFYKDRQGRYLGVNQAFEKFFGKPKDQMVGKTVFDITPPKWAEIHQAKDADLFARSQIQIYEAPMADAQGAMHVGIFHKAPILDSHGTVTGLVGGILDITERKQAEELLAQQLAELRRWQTVTLGREGRIAELKREVNALANRLGQPPPYAAPEDVKTKETR